jgi:hypothetical protein
VDGMPQVMEQKICHFLLLKVGHTELSMIDEVISLHSALFPTR